jgi:hypothetical protein
MAIKELFFDTHDNIRSLALKADQADGVFAVVDLTNVTKVAIEFDDGTTVDSDTYADQIAWDRDPTNGVLDLQLGRVDLVPGDYLGTIICYDVANPNGIRWEPELRVIVKEY